MEKLLASEVVIFPEKNKNFNILLKIMGPNVWIKLSNLPESKVKDSGLSPLPMQNPYSKTNF